MPSMNDDRDAVGQHRAGAWRAPLSALAHRARGVLRGNAPGGVPGPNADEKLSFLKLRTEALGLSVSGGEAQPPCSCEVSVTVAGGASSAMESDAPLASVGGSCEPRRAASAVGQS